MPITGGFGDVGLSCAQACFTYGVSKQAALLTEFKKMSQARLTATELAPHEIALGRQNSKKSIFAVILEALHHSRRLQAERTLRQYRHLIDKAECNILRELNKRSGAGEDVGK
jgi:hypothetical protein